MRFAYPARADRTPRPSSSRCLTDGVGFLLQTASPPLAWATERSWPSCQEHGARTPAPAIGRRAAAVRIWPSLIVQPPILCSIIGSNDG